MSLGDVARKLQAMQADQGWTTTTGQRIFKDAHHGILAGRDKCLTKCSGWLTYRPGQGSGPPAGSRPGPLTGTVVTSCYPAAGPMHYGHPDAGRAQDMGPMYQEAPAAPILRSFPLLLLGDVLFAFFIGRAGRALMLERIVRRKGGSRT